MSDPDLLDNLVYALEQGTLHNPCELLGYHAAPPQAIVRVFLPDAAAVHITFDRDPQPMERWRSGALFIWRGPASAMLTYRIDWTDQYGRKHSQYDCYAFPLSISEYDLQLFNNGEHRHAYHFLGAHACQISGVAGMRFATWAPNAQRISVVGDFNHWDSRRHLMSSHGHTGVWEIFIPEIDAGQHYKFEIRNRDSGNVFFKTDPYARHYEMRPGTASVTQSGKPYAWRDTPWMAQRQSWNWQAKPISVYEAHLGSWQQDENGGFLNYRELAERLVAYVQDMGFTHIELMPISEHPLDASWGYQSTGYFAPTCRFGSPDDFRYFVDYCHEHFIGVIVDWVPAHFPKDDWALARFDGTALYEHEDPRLGEHQDWGTYIFNFGRHEVKSFLISSAIYWLDEFHVDGLRVDAVASMLYLDYSRKKGEWIANRYGGRENLQAIDFLRALNTATHDRFPGTVTIAEESTDWTMVSRPAWLGGLGFTMKWNMGWMHDSLRYIKQDPVYRQYHHHELTFSIIYAFTENFMLPYSHDEVVHGKAPMIYKMPGDEWQRFANLRLLYTFMFTHPGKKLLFMGCEFASTAEWNEESSLDWSLLQFEYHQGVKALVKDLNRLYRTSRALHELDFDTRGFRWIDCHDAGQSVLSFIRHGEEHLLIVLLNFTPVPRYRYRIGVPRPGGYREMLNSDSQYYGGSNVGNSLVKTEPVACMGMEQSLVLTLPPLAGIVLQPDA